MPRVQVFVSSTFTDFQAERDFLLRSVLPKAQAIALEHGVDLAVSSMRWGVTEHVFQKDGVDEICCEEVRRCAQASDSMFFLGMLGNKYGYRPLPDFLNLADYQRAQVKLPEGCLNDLYELDNNCLPDPCYRLRAAPATGRSVEEARQRQQAYETILRHQVHPSGQDQDMPSLLKLKSITDMEFDEALLCMSPCSGNPSIHVINRTFVYPSNEHRHAFESAVSDGAASQAVNLIGQSDGRHSVDEIAWARLESLKLRLKQTAPVRDFEVPWQERGLVTTKTHADYFSALEDHFLTLLTEGIIAAKDTPVPDSYALELEAHSSYAKIKTAIFLERPSLVEQVRKYTDSASQADLSAAKAALDSDAEDSELARAADDADVLAAQLRLETDQSASLDQQAHEPPYLVAGPSGSGKTCLMAWLFNSLRAEYNTKQQPCETQGTQAGDSSGVLVTRFVGVTPQSTRPRTLMLSIVAELRRKLGLPDLQANPTTLKDVISAFHEHLARTSVTKGRPIVVLIDSLDQLIDDENSQLLWIPEALPSNVRLVVSTATRLGGSEVPTEEYTALKDLITRCAGADRAAQYVCSVPFFSGANAVDAMQLALAAQHRQLTSQQLEAIKLALGDDPSPLLVRLLSMLACQWPSTNHISPNQLHSSTETAISAYLSEVEASFGNTLMQHLLMSITASRRGMSAEELEGVLSSNDQVLTSVFQYWEPPARRMPPLLVARILHRLSEFLTTRSVQGILVYSWAHRRFREAAEARYFDHNPDARTLTHAAIADALECMYGDKVASTPSRARYVDEISYNLARCGRVEKLERVLFSYEFLRDKLRLEDPVAAISDTLDASAQLKVNASRQSQGWACLEPPVERMVQSLDHLSSAIRLSLHVVKHDPEQLPAQLVGRLQAAAHLEPIQRLLGGIVSHCSTSICPINTCLHQSRGAVLQSLIGHKDRVFACYFVPPSDDFVVTASSDRTVKLWHLATGLCVRTYMGHFGTMSGLQMACQGRLLAGHGQGLTIWDISSSRPVAQFGDDVHRRHVSAIKFYKDDTLLLSGDHLSQLACWSVVAENNFWKVALLATSSVQEGVGMSGSIRDIDVCGDELAALACGNGLLILWNLASMQEHSRIQHPRAVDTVRFVDENRVMTSGDDRTVRLWDVKTRSQIKEFARLHGSHPITSLQAQWWPATQQLCFLTTSWDKTAQVFDLDTGRPLASFRGHAEWVNHASVSRTKRMIITASDDRTVKLFEFATTDGWYHPPHSREVKHVSFSPDCQHLVSGAWDGTVQALRIRFGGTSVSVETGLFLAAHDDWVTGVHTLSSRPASLLSARREQLEASTCDSDADSDSDTPEDVLKGLQETISIPAELVALQSQQHLPSTQDSPSIPSGHNRHSTDVWYWTCSEDKTLRLWRRSALIAEYVQKAKITCMAVTQDWICLGLHNTGILAIDAKTGLPHAISTDWRHTRTISCAGSIIVASSQKAILILEIPDQGERDKKELSTSDQNAVAPDSSSAGPFQSTGNQDMPAADQLSGLLAMKLVARVDDFHPNRINTVHLLSSPGRSTWELFAGCSAGLYTRTMIPHQKITSSSCGYSSTAKGDVHGAANDGRNPPDLQESPGHLELQPEPVCRHNAAIDASHVTLDHAMRPQYVVTGDDKGVVKVTSLSSLDVVANFVADSAITSVASALNHDNRFLVGFGTAGGDVGVLLVTAPGARQRGESSLFRLDPVPPASDTSDAFSGAPDPVEGVWLRKLGVSKMGLPALRRPRFFVLSDVGFEYFRALENDAPTGHVGRIPLEDILSVEVQGERLLVKTPTRVWDLLANDTQTASYWRDRLAEHTLERSQDSSVA